MLKHKITTGLTIAAIAAATLSISAFAAGTDTQSDFILTVCEKGSQKTLTEMKTDETGFVTMTQTRVSGFPSVRRTAMENRISLP